MAQQRPAEEALPVAFENRIAHYNERVAQKLDAVLPPVTQAPRMLHEAMRYAVFNGGKRVRPLLVYAAGECLQIEEHILDAPAAAIELLHAFSLVHDDLPAMDNDDLRRGKPTLHRKYDEATAILAADALQPLAFGVLVDMPDTKAELRIRLLRLVADACGSIGMTGGQSLDLAAEGRSLTAEAIEHMYAMKTGALIHAAVVAPALLAESIPQAQLAAIGAFGRTIGIAFQIRDDILDVEGDTDVIGKQAGADERLGKATYPGLLDLEQARRRCDELLHGALQRLDDFGEAAASLRWLARFIVERDN
ncbi:MAG: polyprenyl synthetase family protein [Proteobacteria bacterium]|nr:polyprenyl synthetase family protein [Pseudomonadota bacterium]